ncbi:hypothetical protein M4H08_002800 [Listeria monocytogenes]|uniref:hypothetical protein n=1 Tax=Listeria TaxID=1637 RepID=UPI001627873C|nr:MULTISPECIES: hypothetical protein [Listeria]EJE1078930.1 hypothetical protein [Listeria monocytogenes]EJE1814610.1 hypothetical protein [Listeria monocytogenes]EKZ3968294.1 hypothetical protein [Listeria monocytogenes]EKZ4000644.1 hypothetical protein [Listeria monocytogenes]EKZ4006016.1 hypothetical protein [Listeria monocytogenes]
MRLEDYKNLPETMSEEELYSLFSKIIDDFTNKKVDKNELLDILTELMERQVLTYAILKEPLKIELDNLICGLWNTENYNDVDVMLSLIVSLGLERSFNKVKESISDNKNIDKNIIQEIQETIEDTGEHIANPYYDYE